MLSEVINKMKKKHEININPKVLEYIDKGITGSTKKAYRSDWEDFEKFCKIKKYQPLPAKYETIGEYLVYLSDDKKRKPSTIERRISAILRKHRMNQHPLDTKHKFIRPTLEGIKVNKGTKTTKSKPISIVILKKMIDSVNVDDIRSIRDKSLILIGYIGAFRRSELVNLDYEDIEEFDTEGLIIYIKKSKTDQKSEGKKILIPHSENEKYCPVKKLQQWIEVSQIRTGPLFRKINKSNLIQETRLSDKVVALIVKEYLVNAGFDPKQYAGHSLRRGFATSAALAGATLEEIKRTTRHKSDKIVQEYLDDAALVRKNAAKKLGL